MTAHLTQATARRITVAGAAGGVGTTTVAALLVLALRRQGVVVGVADHGGGSLAVRLPAGDPSAATPRVVVEDRAGRPVEAARSVEDDPGSLLVLVTSATPAALSLLPRVLREVEAARTTTSSRLELVLTQVHGHHRPRNGELDALPARTTLLPRDDALAAGGLLEWANLSRRTRATTELLVSAV